MKRITEQILINLDNESLLKALEGHQENNPEVIETDVSFNEAYKKFIDLSTIVKELIADGTFEVFCSLNRRKAINNHLSSLVQQRGNVNQCINNIEIIYDQLLIAGALDPYQDKANYKEKLSHLTKLIRRYNNYVDQLSRARKDLSFVKEQKEKLDNLLQGINDKATDADNYLDEIIDKKTKANNEVNLVSESLEQTRLDRDQIESQKSKINAFYKNIERFKNDMENSQIVVKKLLDKRDTIDNLIVKAEQALKLNSAVGISAAFDTQHKLSNDKKIYKSWLIGAAVFLSIALGLTVWIVGGWGITNNDSWSSIIGRVVAVGVAISGATFCAKRYINQKNIAEDYAYKATLSKSIVAFKDEIESGGTEQVSEYLTKVLAEIHKDPMRSRSDSEKEAFIVSDKNLSILEKMKNLLK